MAKVATANKHIKDRDLPKESKNKDVKQQQDKAAKGKKGFFGTGKYIWWW